MSITTIPVIVTNKSITRIRRNDPSIKFVHLIRGCGRGTDHTAHSLGRAMQKSEHVTMLELDLDDFTDKGTYGHFRPPLGSLSHWKKLNLGLRFPRQERLSGPVSASTSIKKVCLTNIFMGLNDCLTLLKSSFISVLQTDAELRHGGRH